MLVATDAVAYALLVVEVLVEVDEALLIAKEFLIVALVVEEVDVEFALSRINYWVIVGQNYFMIRPIDGRHKNSLALIKCEN